MQACLIHKYGGIEEIKIEDISKPKQDAGQNLVKIHSASLNHLDIWVRKGARGSLLKMPHILGSDASGIIEKTGQEVVLYPGTSCGKCKSCSNGEETECADFGILGMSIAGTFAEYIAAPKTCIFPKPKHMTFEEASAFPLTFLTAWRMLVIKGALKENDTVLIHGIGGGVALAGLILAKALNAKVILTSSSDEKLKKAKKLGADKLINYKTQNVAGEVMKITGNKGVDIVIDSVGASTWPIDFDCVRKGGRIALCGITSGAETSINLRTLYWKQISVFGSTMGSRKDFSEMLKLINQKKLKPVIDSVYPLNQVRQAAAKMEEGKQFGKIVLKIS